MKNKSKSIDAHIIHADTVVNPFKMGKMCGIGFDVKNKDLLGIAMEDWRVTEAVGKHFLSMAKYMKKSELQTVKKVKKSKSK